MTPAHIQVPTTGVFLGVDTGGTFTDFVLLAGKTITIHKVLSTPAAPEQAILQGIEDLHLEETTQKGELVIIHGSTVATNAALQSKGARTVFITNYGLADLLTIGRQARRQLYNLSPLEIPPPVPAELCLETGGRLGADGSVVEPLSKTELQQLRQQLEILRPEAVAINLLFSFLDDRHERQIEAIVPEGILVSRSSYVLPEYKEYERGIATWLNAWLGPVVERYLISLLTSLAPTPISVMQSSGGTISAKQASSRAVNLLLSGPAGGLAAAKYIGESIGETRLITFDMGGTSTDVSLIDGKPSLTDEGRIDDYPVAIPMLDIHTIGAGGGSIAYLDKGGLLQVGPLSAGASPGPACYGLGGSAATVTDAQAVLGRLRTEDFLGGRMSLDLSSARKAMMPLAEALELSIEQAATGIITIANEHMTRALRAISVQRGYNPQDFRLCCFGGAGGLHLCELAEALEVSSAIVPCHSGVLSALGMLVAPCERNLSVTLGQRSGSASETEINIHAQQLRADGRQQLVEEGAHNDEISCENSIDMRYRGQSYTLNIPWLDNEQALEDFHRKHEQRYGHSMDMEVEVITLRVKVQAHRYQIKLPQQIAVHTKPATIKLFGIGLTQHYKGRMSLGTNRMLTGPLLITEETSTILVKPGWSCCSDASGNLLLDRSPLR